ncbi:MAG: PHB depolymerase family esterase [Streptosporangiaceae bacterium]
MRRIWVVLAALVLVGGCQQSSDAPEPGPSQPKNNKVQGVPTSAGTHKLKLEVGTPGHREYLLHVPPNLKSPAPLVLAMHGGASTMGAFEKLTGFNKVADKEGFVVAYPDGFMLSWNAGGCCGPAKVGKVDDVGFLTKLIDKLTTSGIADPKQVYATGFSNGGGMAYSLACAGPGKIKAIGVVEAALIIDCKPDRPLSVMIFHGTADRSVPYDGGSQRDFNDKRPFPPVSKAVSYWLKQDDLPALKDDGPCRMSKGSVAVRLCTIKGGTHEWPDGAAAQLWEFFKEL